MRPSKLLLAIVTVLAVTGSVANAAPRSVQCELLIEDEARTHRVAGLLFVVIDDVRPNWKEKPGSIDDWSGRPAMPSGED